MRPRLHDGYRFKVPYDVELMARAIHDEMCPWYQLLRTAPQCSFEQHPDRFRELAREAVWHGPSWHIRLHDDLCALPDRCLDPARHAERVKVTVERAAGRIKWGEGCAAATKEVAELARKHQAYRERLTEDGL
jgi:hypothetical protein